MLTFIGGLITLTWKIFLTAFAISLLLAILRNGKDTIRKIIETLAMAVRVLVDRLQHWLFTKYKGA